MKRPDNPILAQLDDNISLLHEGEKHLSEAKARLSEQARAISKLTDKQERVDLAIYAYWHMPEIPAADLAYAATGKEHASALHKLMGPVTVGIQCDGCGNPLPITSRTQMKEAQERVRFNDPRWAEGYRVLCSDCESALYKNRQAEWGARDAKNAERHQQLQSMNYGDYLETSDWQRARQSHVNFLRYERKEQYLPCEVCGSEEALGVYHKKLDRLGHEGSDDLVLLGERCLPVVVNNGLIAGKPLPQNLITNCRSTDLEDWTDDTP